MRGVQHPSARQDVDRADVLVAGQSRFGRLHNSLMQLLTIGVQISDSFRRSFALMYQHGRREWHPRRGFLWPDGN